jgi:hypothetical protein
LGTFSDIQRDKRRGRGVQFAGLQRNNSRTRRQMQYQGDQLYKPIEPYQSAFDIINTIQIQELGFIQFWMTSCWQGTLMGVECTEWWVVLQSTDTLFDIGSTT